jgi:hypothetical protein
MMQNKDPNQEKLEKQLLNLEQIVRVLAGKIAFLERENNRRKIASAVRK